MNSQDTLSQRILLVAAAERHNFGDWLLAWSASQLLKKTTASDVEWFALGGLGRGINEFCGPYLDIEDVFEWEPDLVLHVGGETIGCSLDWAYQMSFGAPKAPSRLQIGRQSAYITPQIERIGGVTRTWPTRAFFGLGGYLDQIECSDTAVALRTSAATVRCRTTSARDSLLDANVPAVCAPDLVHYLPYLHVAQRVLPGSYVAVQVSETFYSENRDQIASTLRELATRHKQIVLFVAGIAFHHDSVRTLMDAKEAVIGAGESARIFVHTPLHPLDIVNLIAGADFVVSSSLHAGIVAHSYGVPHATWFSQKAANYLQEWNTGSQVLGSDPGGIRTAMARPLSETSGRQRDLGLVAHAEWMALMREVGMRLPGESEHICNIADDARFGFGLEQRNLHREDLVVERDGLLVERDGLVVERDGLVVERDGLVVERDGLVVERDGLVVERDWWFIQFHRLRHRKAVRFALLFAGTWKRFTGRRGRPSMAD